MWKRLYVQTQHVEKNAKGIILTNVQFWTKTPRPPYYTSIAEQREQVWKKRKIGENAKGSAAQNTLSPNSALFKPSFSNELVKTEVMGH